MISQFIRQELYPSLTAERIYADSVHNFKKSGDCWRGDCHWHDSKSKSSFSVTPSKLVWYCAGCCIGGGATEYLALRDGGNHKPRGAELIKYLTQLSDIGEVTLPNVEISEEEQRRLDVWNNRSKVIGILCQLATDRFWSDEGIPARGYLKEQRGISEDSIYEFHYGLWPKQDLLHDALKKSGCEIPWWCQGNRLDQYTGSIVIPWWDANGFILSVYVARTEAKKDRDRSK